MEVEVNTAGSAPQGTATGENNSGQSAPENAAGAGSPAGETEKSLTQSQVNEIVRERLAQQTKSIYDRYGVSDEIGLDSLAERAKAYDGLKAKNGEYESKIAQFTEELAFLKNNISPERYDDVRTWFKGKGEALTEGTLKDALASHSEWAKSDSIKPQTTAPMAIGAQEGNAVQKSEEESAANLFGLKEFVGK